MTTIKKMVALSLTAALMISLTGCINKAPQNTTPNPDPVTSTPGQDGTEVVSNPFSDLIDELKAKINTVAASDIQPASEDVQKKLLADMEAMVKAKKPSITVFEAFEKGIKQLSPENADQYAAMALSVMRKNSFEDYKPYEDFFGAMPGSDRQRSFFDLAQKYAFNYYDLKQQTDSIEDKELKQMFEQAKAQGYMLASSEGMIYPIVDFTEFAKYREAYTKDFAALMDQEALTTVQILVSDAGLIVPIEHIAALALEADKQLGEVPAGKYRDYLAMTYTDYLRMLFFGTDNTPMYDYESGKLREEVAVLYKRLAEMTGTKTADYVNMQMAILEASEGKYDDATRDKINALLDKVLKDYEVTEETKNSYYNWMSGESY